MYISPISVQRQWVWIIFYRIYEECHINLCECSMYDYC